MSDREPEFDDDPDPTPRPPTRVPGVWKQMPVPVKALIGVLVVIAAIGIYVGFQQSGAANDQEFGGGAIEKLIPNNNDKLLQQGDIGIDLASGYTASLTVNGTPIPDDQLRRIDAFNQVLFTPGPGQAFESWPAGQNCVVATYWKFETGPSQSSVTRPWCFTVV